MTRWDIKCESHRCHPLETNDPNFRHCQAQYVIRQCNLTQDSIVVQNGLHNEERPLTRVSRSPRTPKVTDQMKTRIEQLLVDNPLRKTATLHRLIVNESSEGRFGDPLDFPCPNSSQVAGITKRMKAKLFGHVDTDEAVLKELKTRMVPGVIGEPSAKQAFAFGLAYVNENRSLETAQTLTHYA
ncbi:hypothetical protein AaE_005235 [Aphanomyces astaci]|nr:hypothetical protein AaE_005235 [Aphanomyces astaci]